MPATRTCHVREATATDIPSILALTELWGKEPTTTGHWVYNDADHLQTRLGPLFLVAEVDGVIRGFLIGSLDIGDGLQGMIYQVAQPGTARAELNQLFVHPECRSRGVGSALVQRFRANLAAQGVSCCVLVSMNQDLERIHRFYQKQGFRSWYLAMFTGASTAE